MTPTCGDRASNGPIVLDGSPALPEGAVVEVNIPNPEPALEDAHDRPAAPTAYHTTQAGANDFVTVPHLTRPSFSQPSQPPTTDNQ